MSSEDLPREILSNIFEGLPVKIIIICSSVCKSWRSVITDPGFINSHLNKSKLGSKGYLLHMPLSKNAQQISRVICDRTMDEFFNLDFPFDCKAFNITPAGSCNGLLCLTNEESKYFGRIVYLWNPSIRKLKCIPISPNVIQTRMALGLGFDNVSGDHKVVRLSFTWDCRKCFEIEVYTLQTNLWRRIDSSNVLCEARGSSMAFVKGSAHWIACKRKPNYHLLILSFDFSTEVFQEMKLPASCYKGIGINSEVLAEFHGSLSLLIDGTPTNSGNIQCCYMWVMKEYGVAESWVLQFKFAAGYGISRLPGLTINGDIIYQNNSMEYFLCDPTEGGRHKNTGLRGIRNHMLALTESLVLLEEH